MERWQMSAVSLKSSFSVKEECFSLFHSVHQRLSCWRLKGEVKLISLPFLLSAYETFIQQRSGGWKVFTPSPLRLITNRTHFRLSSVGCSGRKAADWINRGWTLRRHGSCGWTVADATRSLSWWAVWLITLTTNINIGFNIMWIKYFADLPFYAAVGVKYSWVKYRSSVMHLKYCRLETPVGSKEITILIDKLIFKNHLAADVNSHFSFSKVKPKRFIHFQQQWQIQRSIPQ